MVINTIASARCIRAWPLLQRGDESHLQSCGLRTMERTNAGCSAPLLPTTDDCRTGIDVSGMDSDMLPNPASCARRCRRPRG